MNVLLTFFSSKSSFVYVWLVPDSRIHHTNSQSPSSKNISYINSPLATWVLRSDSNVVGFLRKPHPAGWGKYSLHQALVNGMFSLLSLVLPSSCSSKTRGLLAGSSSNLGYQHFCPHLGLSVAGSSPIPAMLLSSLLRLLNKPWVRARIRTVFRSACHLRWHFFTWAKCDRCPCNEGNKHVQYLHW